MTKNQIHEWRDRLAEYSGRRTFRGYWNSREWLISVFDSEADDWVRLEQPSAELWLSLRKTLWNKYLRRRLAHKMVARVDAILEGLGYTNDDLNRICGHGVTEASEDEE